MENKETDFSSLKTVTAFDKGDETTVALNLESEELERFSPSSLLVESLIEQLCRLLEKDPRKWRKLYLNVCEKLHQMRLIDSSYGRDEFEFMRSYYQKALYQLLTIAKSTTLDKAVVAPQSNDSLKISAKGEIQWSRYSNEFEELEYVAKGGFGHVYKARHKLDGGVYAVKKIYLRYRNVSDFLQYIREVKMLAKLNHPNIVAYKAAWLEPFTRKKKFLKAIDLSDDSKETKDDSLEVVFEGSSPQNMMTPMGTAPGCEPVHTSDRITTSTAMTSSQNLVSYSSTSTTSSSTPESDGDVGQGQRRIIKYSNQFEYQSDGMTNLPEWAILYIQMQLCHQTMRQWLDARNSSTPNIPINIHTALEIFSKIVKGVEYIHSQGIVHHDIKPSNVFVSGDLQEVQVGDFGLACSLLSHPPSQLSVLTNHSQGPLGTKLYAAPEQLRGLCNPKSDVYSLGIVLFELIQPFATAMERSKVIGQLKCGHIPSELITSHPFVCKILEETLSGSLKRRPSSSELLRLLNESQHLDSQRLLAEQLQTIQRLRKESLEKDEEIASLREELKLLKMQRDSLP